MSRDVLVDDLECRSYWYWVHSDGRVRFPEASVPQSPGCGGWELCRTVLAKGAVDGRRFRVEQPVGADFPEDVVVSVVWSAVADWLEANS